MSRGWWKFPRTGWSTVMVQVRCEPIWFTVIIDREYVLSNLMKIECLTNVRILFCCLPCCIGAIEAELIKLLGVSIITRLFARSWKRYSLVSVLSRFLEIYFTSNYVFWSFLKILNNVDRRYLRVF